jgi:hypothetical protein
MIEGNLSNNQVGISEHIVKYYQKLFEEQCLWRLRVDGLVFDQILDHEVGWLERVCRGGSEEGCDGYGGG